MKSYPNQNIIIVNKTSEETFLKVGSEEWKEAYKQLKPSAFAIYLYIADNKQDYKLALSQQAVENALGIKKTAYHEAINSLKELGYLYSKDGGYLFFSPSPQKRTQTEVSAKTNLEVRKNEPTCPQKRTYEFAKTNLEVRKNDRETENREKKKTEKTKKAPAPQAAQTPPTKTLPREKKEQQPSTLSQAQIDMLNQLDEELEKLPTGAVYDNSLYLRYDLC